MVIKKFNFNKMTNNNKQPNKQIKQDNLQQISGNEQNQEQLKNYEQNYNPEKENELKPFESEKQPIQVIPEAEEGFLTKINGCSCGRQAEENTEINNEGCIMQIDRQIYLEILNSYLFATTFYQGLFLFVQLLKGLLIYFLNDEWLDELQFLDSFFKKGWRLFKITFFVLSNLDVCYWIYYIYRQNKKDGTIEYVMTLCRMIDAFFFNFPQMIVFFYLLCKTQKTFKSHTQLLQVKWIHAPKLFCWNLISKHQMEYLFICELYVKLFLVVSVFIKLYEFNIEYECFSLFCLCGLIQYQLFTGDQDITGQILSIIYFQLKTFIVITFKEESFAMSDLDCDAQPGIFNVVVQSQRMIYEQLIFLK
ncbi:unnamed protein product [Paramecium octaurelia]|uniref:Uncharacterized protein n=1 Tax=Paramecium octaurelia TaxID=43137 RepID=A0A8S1WFM2_PAROT|nr:unnamed protein product [Paramecium octaurelia]